MRIKILIFFFLISNYIYSQKQNPSIGFIENKGQIVDQNGKQNKEVLYLLNTPGLNVQIKKNGFSYDVYETKKIPLIQKDKLNTDLKTLCAKEKHTPEYSLEYKYHRIDIDFVGSNSNVEIIKAEKSTDYDNYYNVPSCPNGITNVHKFKKITYKNIYSHIDLDFFIPKDTTKAVEYNFIIRPGGKISDIQLKIKGGKTELIDNKIRMTTRFGKMEETIPMSWIEDDHNKKLVAINYKKIENNIYGFEGNVNTSNKTMVIDPTPTRLWGTYYGGSAYDFYTSTVKVDHLDNVYLTGQTVSLDNIATTGAFQVFISYPITAAYIAKLDSNGVRLWGSYIHNYFPSIPISQTTINDIAINSFSEIYIVGLTRADDGPNNITTPNSHKEFQSNNYTSGDDGFIIKFNSNGLRIWGTFFGGESRDHIKTITLDRQENLIIAGETHSNGEISTSNSFQTTRNNQYGPVGFFSKFSPAGNQLYGSYFPREIYESTIDNMGNLIFAGQYEIANYYPDISTSGAHQTQTYYQDGFIIKFDSSFNRLWSTYYGGNSIPESISSNADVITGISTDTNNNIYICGYTNSQTNITTPGAFKESHIDPSTTFDVDTFLVKFNSQGVRQWGTFFGGNTSDDKCYDGMVAENGDFYFVGQTLNISNIATPNSYQPYKNPYDDGFFGKFDTNGQLIWSSYFGGNFYDSINNVDVKNNVIYFSGNTGSSDVISTPGTHKTFVEGGDAFIEKFIDCNNTTTIISSNSPICIGQNLQLNASGGTNYTWTGPNGFTSNDQNPIINNANATHSGQYSCAITGTGGCDNTITINVLVGDTAAPIPTITNLPTITGDCTTVISTIPTALDNCSGTINATTTNPLNYSIPGNYTITWNYSDGNGNSSSQTQNVTITSVALPTLTSPQQFCIQQNVTLNSIAITGTNILWYDAQTGGNLLPSTTLLQNGITYYASQTINSCESERVAVTAIIQNTSAPTATNTQSFCSTANANLNDIAITGTNIIWYASQTSTTPLTITTPLANGITYFASQTVNGCESVNRTPVTISLINTLNANDFSDYLCDDLNNGQEKIDLTTYNTLLLSSTAGNTFSYYKSLIGAQNQTPNDKINNASNYHLTVGSSQIYVRIDNVNSCHQIVILNLTLYSKPIIPIDEVTPMCQGTPITINAGNFDQYLWSTGANTPSISIANAGDYWVEVTENHIGTNCTSRKDFKVVNSNKATIQNITISDWTDHNNSISIILTVGSLGDYEYSIDGIVFQNENTFTNLPIGEYTVYVRDRNGCGVANDLVYLITYPKFFTPNNDGQNDFWKIKFTNQEPNLIINIYNRFGKLLKSLHNDSEGWDGTYLGQPQPADDYWFTVIRPNGKEYKEHFALKR